MDGFFCVSLLTADYVCHAKIEREYKKLEQKNAAICYRLPRPISINYSHLNLRI